MDIKTAGLVGMLPKPISGSAGKNVRTSDILGKQVALFSKDNFWEILFDIIVSQTAVSSLSSS